MRSVRVYVNVFGLFWKLVSCHVNIPQNCLHVVIGTDLLNSVKRLTVCERQHTPQSLPSRLLHTVYGRRAGGVWAGHSARLKKCQNIVPQCSMCVIQCGILGCICTLEPSILAGLATKKPQYCLLLNGILQYYWNQKNNNPVMYIFPLKCCLKHLQ